jgi:hypothetical protein
MDKVIEILEVMVKSSNTSGSELEYVLSEIKKEKLNFSSAQRWQGVTQKA